MAKKVYAIKEGFDSKNNEKVENRIVNTWSECLKYVKGVKGAKYKSFEKRDEAEKYLSEGSKLLKKEDNNYPKDCMHIYVDGSYSIETEKYSYGVVAVRDNVVEYIESDAAKDTSKKNIRQIAGELKGAIKAVKYALKKGEKRVVVFHDYEGVCHHATGFWERREESSIKYYKDMNELISSGIEVIFVKVDSHTGDLFNELVDEMCKDKLNIQSDKVVEKWLKDNIIKVKSEKVKKQILKVAPSGDDNILVVEDKACERKGDEKTQDISTKDYILNKLNLIVSSLPEDKQIDILNYAEYINSKYS